MTVPTYKEAKDAMRKAGIQGVTDGDNWTGQDNGLFQRFAVETAYKAGEPDNARKDQVGFVYEGFMTPSVAKAIHDDTPPVVYSGTLIATPNPVTKGQQVTGNLAETQAPSDSITVNWGDGTAAQTINKGQPINHTYTAAGSYTISATATVPGMTGAQPVTVTGNPMVVQQGA
ncbi:hypothetical protein [Burkholderia phage BCSR5]|nr:hypothetical protein [Burkholderia phage BCSR5]